MKYLRVVKGAVRKDKIRNEVTTYELNVERNVERCVERNKVI